MHPTENLILAALTEKERQYIVPAMHTLELTLGRVLHEHDQGFAQVVFPVSGAISLMVFTNDGRSVEPALIGREGAFGYPLILQPDDTPWRAVVRVPGRALAIPARELQDHLNGPGRLDALLLCHLGRLMRQMALAACCTQLHSLEQRICQTILLMSDRVAEDRLSITHNQLATMLGIRRQTATGVLAALRRRRLIRQQRGAIQVLDRHGLEAATCECYARLRPALEGVVGVTACADQPDRRTRPVRRRQEGCG